MKYNPAIHHRGSIRLKGYDYSQAGAYFVTLCIQNRQCVLGDVSDGKVKRSLAGDLVVSQWLDLPKRFPAIELDSFVVMPNHFHGIISIGAQRAAPLRNTPARAPLAAPNPHVANTYASHQIAPELGKIIRAFKSLSAIAGNRMLGKTGQPFWQRNYWEHVIRNEKELMTLREYIENNPAQWELDSLYESSKN